MPSLMHVRRLFEQIHEDWCVHRRDWSKPGFRALAVYRFGKSVDSWPKGFLRAILRRIHHGMFRFIRNHYGIELPVQATVGRRLTIVHQNGIVIHPSAIVGDDCVIRQNVTIGAATMGRIDGAPKLGRGVQVGCGAVIVGKVNIGDGAIIGPNVVVMTNVPAGATVFMEPPRVIQLQKSHEGWVGRPNRI